MRLIPSWALKPGMEVARNVKSGKGAPLLKAGVKLQIEYIQQLKKMKIPAVYINDSLIPDVYVEDVILDETRERAIQLVKKTLTDFKNTKNPGLSRVLSAKKELTDILDDIVNQLLSSKNLTINLSDIRYTDDYTFAHSVNVAVLSIMTAISLGLNKAELKKIGLGSFLHDLGKVLVPLAILNKPNRLLENERAEIEKHPLYGLDLIKERNFLNGLSGSIIHKHHERINGSGYPQGLKGKDIELYPKICAVSDVYDALVSDRPYRPGFMPYRAMEIMDLECEGYDLEVMQTFYHHISAYPVGTLVGLSNNCVGVVVNNTHGHSFCPRVRVVCTREEPDFLPLEQFEIDLVQNLNVTVERVYQDHELPGSILGGD